MNCNKDERCLYIAKEYAKAESELEENFKLLKNEMTDINDKIVELKVPDDYLGSKVINELSKIKDNIESDIKNIDITKPQVIDFVLNKQNEHQNHYNNWLLNKEKD